MNEYLVELYSWLDTNHDYSSRYTVDDFQDNMQDESFALEMYEWLNGVDETFSEREPIEIWSKKVKKKRRFRTANFFWSSGNYGIATERFVFGYFKSKHTHKSIKQRAGQQWR